MSALSAAVSSGNFNHLSARSSAPVVKNTRKVQGFSINAIGQIRDASFMLEYSDSGTRITCGDKSCMVNFAYSNHNAALVHVQLRSDKIKPLHELWSGVRGGKLVGRIGDDCFMKVGVDDHLTVFYNDGTVAIFRTLEPSAKAFTHNLSAAQAFEARFGHVKKMLVEAEQMQGNDKILRQDRQLHELAAIVGMSTRYPDLRKQVIDYVVELGIMLRKNVFDHFCKACTHVSDMDAWMQIRAFNDNQQAGVKTATSPLRSVTKENALAIEKARKKVRSENDQIFRNKMKTASNGGGGKQQGQGKGKKSKK